MVKIRLSRGGRKHLPIYTIVAADSRNARNGKFLEKLGQYDPKSQDGEKVKGLKLESLKKWIQTGAICSDTVRTLLKKQKIQLS